MADKKMFGFRATPENIKIWKAYAVVTGQTMSAIGTAAMQEYIKNHVTDVQQTLIDGLTDGKAMVI